MHLFDAEAGGLILHFEKNYAIHNHFRKKVMCFLTCHKSLFYAFPILAMQRGHNIFGCCTKGLQMQ
jgi:hypothetical protein